jgi:hypothetical protein
MATATARTAPSQGEILAESGEFLDWDGNEVETLEQTYDEYVNSRPPKEDLRRFRQPIYYWEVKAPGCSLQPYPTMGAFQSTGTGLWTARNPAQDTAIRTRILSTTGVDPDEMRLSSDDLKALDGDEKLSRRVRFCQDCFFVCSNQDATNLHEILRGHSTKSQPRKDD